MALLAQVVRVCAKYGSAARFAVKQVLNFCPGGVALADTVDALLESVQDKSKELDEEWWKRAIEKRLGVGEEEQRRLSKMLKVIQTQMAELLEVAIEGQEKPQQIEMLVIDALRRHEPLRKALRRVETLALEMTTLRRRVDKLCRGQEEMRPLVERAVRFSACVEELEGEGLTPSLVSWMRGMRAAERDLAGGHCEEAERAFATQAAERPASTAAAVGCAAAQSAGHKFIDAEQSLSRILAVQGNRADPELVELHAHVTVHSHGVPTPVKPSPATPARTPREGDRMGEWRLEKFLARGGLGQVFLATREGERGALKILHPELSQRPGFDALFKQEMKAMMRLDPHPHLVSIVDFDRDPVFGCQFFVMPYIQGMTLERYLVKNGAIPEKPARRLFAGLADGLACAHKRGVQHRDIKPANIIVQADGNAVLIDWGLSGLTGVTGHTQTAGYTAFFAAPETFRTGRPDPSGKSDVYCLAASLYFAVLHGDATRRSTFEAEFAPEGLRDLLRRPLRNDPEARPSAREFLELLSDPAAEQRKSGRVREGESVLVRRYAEMLERTQANVSADDKAALVKLCREYDVPTERANALLREERRRWDEAALGKLCHEAAEQRKAERVREGESLLVQRYGEILDRTQGNATVEDRAALGKLCREYGVSQERATAIVREEQRRWDLAHPPQIVRRAGELKKVELGSVEMRFAWCPPGTFLMGSPPGEVGRNPSTGADESQHRVTLTKGVWMGVTPVTQAQWQAVMRNNPSYFKGNNRPVEQVSWEDCQEFCKKFGAKVGKRLRLPTEAEWEYACRAGTMTPFSFGETINTDQANYDGNYTYAGGKKGKYREETTPVGSFEANAWGLHDMHGNVWEWCKDWFGPYTESDIEDPQGYFSGSGRVLRGGFWGLMPHSCRAASRDWNVPTYRSNECCFRVVLCLD